MIMVTKSIQYMIFFVVDFGSKEGASKANKTAEINMQTTITPSYLG